MSKNKLNIDKIELEQDDYEYEKKIAEEERAKREEKEKQAAAAKAERERKEREAEKDRERQLEDEKRELLKLRSGLADENDSELTKKEEAYEKPTGMAAVANFWYHYKFAIVFSFIALCVVGFLFYTEATRKRDDLCVMVVTDNDLVNRQEEIEAFFEKYVDDLDGNGYVHVGVIEIQIGQNVDAVTRNTYSQKFMAQVQTGEAMIVLTDSHTPEEFMEVMNTELEKDFPGNKYINEQGFSFNSKVMSDELKYELMPNDVYMSIRTPVETIGMNSEDAQANYDESFEVYKKIVDDITARCEETDDKGLDTEPIIYENTSSSADESE